MTNKATNPDRVFYDVFLEFKWNCSETRESLRKEYASLSDHERKERMVVEIPELISMKFYSDQYYAKALELNGKHWEALRKVIEETVNLARRVSLYEFFE